MHELQKRIGEELAVSEWFTVTQEQVNLFADATGDYGWIHTDPDRATKTKLGGTIAHGFLIISLAGGFLYDAVPVRDFPFVLNYGVDHLRFVTPLPVGCPIRMRTRLDRFELAEGAANLAIGLTFEGERSDRPICVASWLLRCYASEPA